MNLAQELMGLNRPCKRNVPESIQGKKKKPAPFADLRMMAVRSLVKSGWNMRDIGAALGLSSSHVSRLNRGITTGSE